MMILLICCCVLLLVLIALVITFRPRPNNNLFSLSTRLDEVFKKLDGISTNLREDFRVNREESARLAAQGRTELNETLNSFRREMNETLQLITIHNKSGIDTVNTTLDARITTLSQNIDAHNRQNREGVHSVLQKFSEDQGHRLQSLQQQQDKAAVQLAQQLERIIDKLEKGLQAVNEQAKADNHTMRQALEASFRGFGERFTQSVSEMNGLQRERFGQLEEKQARLVDTTEKRLDSIRETVEEKLQKTLQDRLGQSFDVVTRQLSEVQKGLGEMQTLAQDVGGLKKVLSNVKMRGGFGEVQLHMLLENILAPEQYEANVATKKGSAERVEFAVKFPNRENDREYVWLPIDAKFPKDAYEHLQTSYESGDTVLIEGAQKSLEAVIKKMAKDICEKYIDAPNTTNFGIMFLPFEGLFAEVVRKSSLLEEIQRDCQVVITGPTTLAVILNSLQMGFRTLAIQKRSSEVWQILGSAKREFNLFGSLLEKAQNNIQTGLNQLDDVVGKRTRAIQRTLKNVEMINEEGIENGTTAGLLNDE